MAVRGTEPSEDHLHRPPEKPLRARDRVLRWGAPEGQEVPASMRQACPQVRWTKAAGCRGGLDLSPEVDTGVALKPTTLGRGAVGGNSHYSKWCSTSQRKSMPSRSASATSSIASVRRRCSSSAP